MFLWELKLIGALNNNWLVYKKISMGQEVVHLEKNIQFLFGVFLLLLEVCVLLGNNKNYFSYEPSIRIPR
jgi:hypothetical protein